MNDYDAGKLTFFGPEAVKLFEDYEFGKNNVGRLLVIIEFSK